MVVREDTGKRPMASYLWTFPTYGSTVPELHGSTVHLVLTRPSVRPE
jgi:hypothetical protein